jgi:hypothetical protein
MESSTMAIYIEPEDDRIRDLARGNVIIKALSPLQLENIAKDFTIDRIWDSNGGSKFILRLNIFKEIDEETAVKIYLGKE